VVVMATDLLDFFELSKRDLARGKGGMETLAHVRGRDRIEVSIVRSDGTRQTVRLPQAAQSLIKDALSKLGEGQRVAVLREDAELSPEQAAMLLGMSRPLVVKRMDDGRLPFRYVGAHRRSRLSDVLKLQRQEQTQREALERLAEDSEDLMANHGL
jgi:excisionase family DNA binding protein